MSTKEFFSPKQIYVGTFIGGPLAAAYYLSENFKIMGQKNLDTICKVLGLVFTVVLFAYIFQLPEDFPNTIIPIVYSAIAAGIAWQWQVTKEEAEVVESYSFQSNWRVAGISILSLVVTFAFLFLLIFFMSSE